METGQTAATPLIQKPKALKQKSGVLTCIHVLICGFVISLSITFTRVPMLFVIRNMACDDYYRRHPSAESGLYRCATAQVEGETANALSLLGTTTTLTGVLNLLCSSWLIKRFGVKMALVQQTLWPAVRSALQIVAIKVGGSTGIHLIVYSQLVCSLGGSTGYLLVTNAYVAKLVEGSEQTAVLGVLQGFIMFGNAFGYFLGGFFGDLMGIQSPFDCALILMLLSMFFALIFLPFIPTNSPESSSATESNGLKGALAPLKLFIPQKFRSTDAVVQRHYHVALLGTGIFFGVLATGFIPIIIQLYATSAFNFRPTENGYLMSFNFLIRGMFLSFGFPRVIAAGRNWFNRPTKALDMGLQQDESYPTQRFEGEYEYFEQPVVPGQSPPQKRYSSSFDLLFLKLSLFLDGILTASAAFSRKPWHIYMSAFLIPLASGSAPAAKGVMMEMCHPTRRDDALTAISLIETIATVLTMSIFGKLYAVLAEAGAPSDIFFYNAGVALLAVTILTFCNLPDSDEIDDFPTDANEA